jgi:hypothetical protein
MSSKSLLLGHAMVCSGGPGVRWSAGVSLLWGEPPLPTHTLLQVGPDDPELVRNALLELLVHLSKRDAFNILRTQQQVGCYAVTLIGHCGVKSAGVLAAAA